MAVYMGFLVAYGATSGGQCTAHCLPTVTVSDCTDDPGLLGVNCLGVLWDFIHLVFNVLTLGGVDSPLPVLYVQAPLVLFFALTWGFIIVGQIEKIAEILAEAVP